MQLSDRILVMTFRPGRVKRIVEIDLPRPRTSEIVSSTAFGRYVAEIWGDLREEATRGMQESEASARERKRLIAWPRDRARVDRGEPCASASPPSWLRRCVVEWMLRIGILNRYIVPLPSEVMAELPAHRRRGEDCRRVR